jgi:hypothetical protein
MLDRSLAFRFKSRRGLPRVRIARISWLRVRSASYDARASFFLASAAFTNARTILAAVPRACGGKRLQPRGEAWRLSQCPLIDESSR